MENNYQKTQVNLIRRVCSVVDSKIEFFRDQAYDKLKRQCLANKVLFEDPYFPPIATSMYQKGNPPRGILWKRPSEIVPRGTSPKFVVDTAHANDISQGSAHDCWFIAGCAALAYVPELFAKVVPLNQTFNEGDYAGIFHFRFWLYGTWYDVVVDDRLPVNQSGQLIFCRNRYELNEFWPALVEKAFAKVYGCYENLDGGFLGDALVDMTGGIQESYSMKEFASRKQELWEIIIKSRKLKSMNGASIEPISNITEGHLANGLVTGHAYTITRVASIEVHGREVFLIRLRNPWGNESEWKGKWSDNDSEWKYVADNVKKAIEYKNRLEGEFWMSFDDFCRNFDKIEFCSLTPDAFPEEAVRDENDKKNLVWKTVAYHGEWKMGVSAGGCGQSNRELYWTNPQFLVTLTDVDSGDKQCTMIVSLMQKYTRENRSRKYSEPYEEFIQFRVYKIKNSKDADNAKRNGTKLYANQLVTCGELDPYINKREVTKRYRLEPADYLIIPSCYDIVEGKFLLRVFTEKPIKEQNTQILITAKQHLTESDIFFSPVSHTSLDKHFDKWLNLLDDESSSKPNMSFASSSFASSTKPNVPLAVSSFASSLRQNPLLPSPVNRNAKEETNARGGASSLLNKSEDNTFEKTLVTFAESKRKHTVKEACSIM